jgi:hypothetical protein
MSSPNGSGASLSLAPWRQLPLPCGLEPDLFVFSRKTNGDVQSKLGTDAVARPVSAVPYRAKTEQGGHRSLHAHKGASRNRRADRVLFSEGTGRIITRPLSYALCKVIAGFVSLRRIAAK